MGMAVGNIRSSTPLLVRPFSCPSGLACHGVDLQPARQPDSHSWLKHTEKCTARFPLELHCQLVSTRPDAFRSRSKHSTRLACRAQGGKLESASCPVRLCVHVRVSEQSAPPPLGAAAGFRLTGALVRWRSSSNSRRRCCCIKAGTTPGFWVAFSTATVLSPEASGAPLTPSRDKRVGRHCTDCQLDHILSSSPSSSSSSPSSRAHTFPLSTTHPLALPFRRHSQLSLPCAQQLDDRPGKRPSLCLAPYDLSSCPFRNQVFSLPVRLVYPS